MITFENFNQFTLVKSDRSLLRGEITQVTTATGEVVDVKIHKLVKASRKDGYLFYAYTPAGQTEFAKDSLMNPDAIKNMWEAHGEAWTAFDRKNADRIRNNDTSIETQKELAKLSKKIKAAEKMVGLAKRIWG